MARTIEERKQRACEAVKRWQNDNREKYNEYMRAYRKANKERINEINRRYWAKKHEGEREQPSVSKATGVKIMNAKKGGLTPPFFIG